MPIKNKDPFISKWEEMARQLQMSPTTSVAPTTTTIPELTPEQKRQIMMEREKEQRQRAEEEARWIQNKNDEMIQRLEEENTPLRKKLWRQK